jgi:hypothetical protein
LVNKGTVDAFIVRNQKWFDFTIDPLPMEIISPLPRLLGLSFG